MHWHISTYPQVSARRWGGPETLPHTYTDQDLAVRIAEGLNDLNGSERRAMVHACTRIECQYA